MMRGVDIWYWTVLIAVVILLVVAASLLFPGVALWMKDVL